MPVKELELNHSIHFHILYSIAALKEDEILRLRVKFW